MSGAAKPDLVFFGLFVCYRVILCDCFVVILLQPFTMPLDFLICRVSNLSLNSVGIPMNSYFQNIYLLCACHG